MISKSILDNVFSGICILDKDFKVLLWNRLLEQYTGISRENILSKHITDIFSAFSEESIVLRLKMVFENGTPIVFSSLLHKNMFVKKNADKKVIFLETTATLLTIDNKKKSILLTIKDVTELNLQIAKYRKMKDRALAEVERRKNIENILIKNNKSLKMQASTDTLTTLYNRRYMMDRLEEELDRVHRYGGSFSIIISDIDLFKRINDTYGHDCGDYILKEVSSRLKNNIRNIDTLARWGGEEFLFCLPETGLKQSIALAEKLRKIITTKDMTYNDKNINISMTFGVANFIPEDKTVENIIKKADISLYNGKNSGRNCVSYT